MDLKPESHILVHHLELVNLFQLLGVLSLSQRNWPVNTLEEWIFHLDPVAVLRVWEEHTNVLVHTLDRVWLHQVCIGAVRLHYRARDLTLLSGEHQLGNVVRVVSFKFIFPFFAIILVWVLYFDLWLLSRLLLRDLFITLLGALVNILKAIFIGILVIIIVIIIVSVWLL